jgi:hypothetical protein
MGGEMMHGKRRYLLLPFLLLLVACPREEEVWVEDAPEAEEPLIAPEDEEAQLRLVATYGYKERKKVANRFKVGEALVGQAALEKQSILISDPPDDYVRIASALGEAKPKTIEIGVPAVLISRQIMGPVSVLIAWVFSLIVL